VQRFFFFPLAQKSEKVVIVVRVVISSMVMPLFGVTAFLAGRHFLGQVVSRKMLTSEKTARH